MIGSFKRKSLDSILSSFTQTLNDLDNLRRNNAEKFSKAEVKVLVLTQQMTELNEESAKASSVYKKLSELVS